MATYRSILLNPKQIPKHWVEIEPLISKALEYSAREWNTFEILKLALDDKIQIWLTIDANISDSGQISTRIVCVTTTMIITFRSNKRVLHILTMSGNNLQQFLSQDEALVNYAKEKGVDAIRAEGRKGWDRFTKNKYKNIYHVYERNLAMEGD